eukprot:c26895_g1_i1 orf=1109-1354(-)
MPNLMRELYTISHILHEDTIDIKTRVLSWEASQNMKLIGCACKKSHMDTCTIDCQVISCKCVLPKTSLEGLSTSYKARLAA